MAWVAVYIDAADVIPPDVEGYTCPTTLARRYSDCPPRPRSCRDLQTTDAGGDDSSLPADVDCLPGCHCEGDLLFDDHGRCVTVDRCPCYHPYTGLAVPAGSTADLLCGEW